METKIKKYLSKQRICALLTMLIMLLDMFSPYSVLLNKVNAVSPIEQNKPYFELSLHPIDASGDYDDWDEDTCYYYYDYDEDTDTPETYSGTRIVTMDIFIKNGQTVPRLNAGNIKLRYDKSVFTPIKENVKVVKKQTIITLDDPTDMEDWTLDGIYFDPSPATGLDLEEGIFRIDGATTETMEDTTLVATVQLKLGEGKTLADLTPDIFSISDDDDIMLAYDGGAYYVNGRDYLLFSGFQAGTPQVDSIEFKTAPTKNKYYHTETLDFTNGIITATYDNGDTEDINIASAIASGDLTVNSTTASSTTKKVTLNYKGRTLDFEYYVLDSIAVKTNPSNIDYEHDDTLSFTGGVLTASYVNLSNQTVTEDISMTNPDITTNRVKADYNNPTVNLTYHGKTATVNLNVTDPIKSIAITTSPTDLTYDNGETISLAGGIITATTKSGATTTVATDAASVTPSITKANISAIPAGDRWTSTTSGLECGKQKVTLTYEGFTDDYEILVNDTISSISVTSDPTAKNKYGTVSGSLDLTGMVVTATTSGGGTCTLAPGSVNVDFTGYNPNTLDTQSFNVSYGTITSSNKVNIKLTNYITGITSSFSQTEFDYNTPVSTIVASGTYIENYADGTSSSSKPLTAGMITGYVQTPAASLFGNNHKYNETLTIKLTTSSNSFDVLPATATQVITINDVIDNITIYDKPIKTTYKIGDDFNSNGGKISVNYKSGNNTIVSMGSTGVTLSETDGSAVTANPDDFVDGVATKPVTVTYSPNGSGPYTTSFNIKITDIISSLDLSNAPSVLKYGETLAFNIGVNYQSGKSSTVSFADVTSNFSASTVGTEQTVYVTYGGYSDTTGFKITVKDYVTGITLSKNSVTDTYGTSFSDLVSDNTLKYTVTYAKAGNKPAQWINDGVVSVTPTYDPTKASQNLTITYTDNDVKSYTKDSTFDATLNVTLSDAITKVTITEVNGEEVTAGERVNVKYNTPFKVKALIEHANTANNETKEFNSTDSEITWTTGGTTNLGNAEIKLTYNGETDTSLVKVQDYVTGITLSSNTVTDELGTSLNDLVSDNNLKYQVVYAKAGAQTAKAINDGIVSITPTYDPTKATQSLTITYTDNDTNSYTKTQTFTDGLTITLSDVVTGIKITSVNGTAVTPGNRIDVKYDTAFNIEATILHADTNNNENKTYTTSSTEVTWDAGALTTVGNGTVKVTYNGFTDTADVKVKDYVTGITLSQSTLTDTYGTTFSDLVTNNSLEYTVRYASAGAKTAQAINDGVVSITPTYDPEALTQQLTITYTDSDTNSYTKDSTFDATLDITLNDAIKKVTITEIDGNAVTAGGRIDVKYNTPFKVKATIEHAISANNETKEFDSTDAEVTWTTGGTANLGNAEILLTVGGESDTALVKVKDYVTGITLSSSSISDELDTPFANLVSDNSLKYTVNYAKAGAQTAQWINDGVVSIAPTYDQTAGTQQLTITYTDNDTNSYTKDSTFDATLNVTLSDAVTGVEIKSVNGTAVTTGGRTDVKFGTDFDVEVLVKHADTANNETKSFSTTNSEVSWDAGSLTTVGNGTIKVTYSGFTDTADVKVKDYVEKIQLTQGTVTDELGTTFTDLVSDNNLKYQVVYKSAGAQTAQAINDGVVSITPTYDPTQASQSLTITYTDNDTNSYTKDSTFDATLDITLSDIVTKVTITEVNGSPVTPGEKINVKFDETFQIKAYITHADTANNETKEFDSTDTEVSWTTGAITTIGDAEILLTYGGESDTTNVKVQDYVTGITLSSSSVSDELDTTFADLVSDNSLTYTVVYASAGAQTAQAINDGVVSISPIYDPTASTQQLTITYTDTDTNSYTKDSTFDVTLDITLSDAVTGIEIKSVNGTAVTTGERIDVKFGTDFDVEVLVKHADIANNETKSFSTTNSEVSWDAGSLTTVGNGTIKVTYSGFTDTADVNVKDYVDKIQLIPSTVTDELGTTFTDLVSDNNLKYQVVYKSAGAQTAQWINDGVVSITPTYDPTLATQSLTITYTDNDTNSYTKDSTFDETLNVTLSDVVTKVTITEVNGSPVTPGEKINVKFDETFKIKADITHADTSNNETKEFDSTDTEVSWTTGAITTIGDAEILLTYGGESDTTNVKVQDYVTGITLSSSSVSDELDTTFADLVSDNSLTYTVVYASAGAQTAQAIDDGVVSISPIYDPTASTQQLTITYTDNDTNSYTKNSTFDATLDITLSDAVTGIEITKVNGTAVTTGGRTDVKFGTDFDVEVLVKHADTANNETKTFSTTNSEVSWNAGSLTTVGNGTIKVTYNGFTDTADVNVKDYVTGITLSQSTVTDELDTTFTDLVSDNNLKYTVTYASAGAQTAQAINDGVVSITPTYDPTLATQTLTITYTDNDTNSYTKDETFDATLNITLSDAVTGIEIKSVNGTAVTPGGVIDVKYGEAFDIVATVKHADTANNETKTFSTTNSEVTWDAGALTTVGNGTVKVTYNGFTDTADVKVKDYVTGIALSQSTVTDEYGTAFADLVSDNSLKYTVTYASAGAQTAQAIDDGVVSISPIYDPTASTQQLTITYTDTDTNSYTKDSTFDATLDITLSDAVTGIEIKAVNGTAVTPGGVIDVKYDEEFDIEVLVKHADTANNETKTFKSSDSEVTWTTGSSTTVGNADILLTYLGESDTVRVKVKDYVTGITLNTNSVTDTYGTSFNDLVNNHNLEYTVTYASAGAKTAQAINDGVVSISPIYDPTASTQTLTITYTDNDTNSYTKDSTFDDTLNVTLDDQVTKVTITEVNGESVTGSRINVKYDEKFKVKAYIEYANTANNTTKEFDSDSSEITWTTGTITTVGNAEILLTYNGESDTSLINVQDYVTGISLNTNTVTDVYGTNFNDLVSNNNLEYTVTYASAGAQTAQAIDDGVVSISPIYDPTASTQTLTITYTDNDTNSYTKDDTFTDTLNITLTDAVTGIEIVSVNGTAITPGGVIDVKYDEDFDIEVLVKHSDTANNENKTFKSSDSEVTWTTGTNTTVGNAELLVTFGSESDTVRVKVKDYVTGISLSTNSVTDTYGTSFNDLVNNNNLEYTVTYKSAGAQTAQAINDGVVSITPIYDSTASTQTLTITYTDNDTNSYTNTDTFTDTLTITLEDQVTSVRITEVNGVPVTPGTRIDVDYGKPFSIKVDVEYANSSNNTTKTITSTDTEVNWTIGSSTTLGNAEIQVTYGGVTDTAAVNVNDYIVDFVLTAPSKTEYEYGESLDLSDAIITIITASGDNTQTVPVTTGMISGYDPTQKGSQTVTVTYEGKTKTFGVTVVDNVQSIEIEDTPNQNYQYGENLDLTGGTIKVTRSSGTEIISITPSMVSGYDPTVLGTQTITVTYEGKTTSYDVEVTDYMDHITITKPDKLLYNLNDPMDLTGGTISVIMASGAVKETIAMDPSMVSGFDTSTTGSKTITVTYPGLPSETFSITVQDILQDMTINTLPDKLDYLYGEKMDLTGGTIKVKRESGNEEIIPMSPSMISGFTTTKLGQVEVTVTYEGISQTFQINVSNYEKEAILVAPNKKDYQCGEDLDLTGGSLSIMMANGEVKEKVDLTASMISGFDTTTPGTKTITVKYKGYTKTYKINVFDEVSGIALNKEPNKTIFDNGEDIDVTGGTIKVIKPSGTTIIDITPDMISGYNPNQGGYQVVTVTYEGKTTQFVVYVYPEVAPSTPDAPQTPNVPQPTTPTTTNTNNTNKKKPQTTSTTKRTTKPSTKPSTEQEQKPVATETPVTTEPVKPVQEKPVVKEKQEQKPTVTLGEKDENKEEKSNKKMLALGLVLGSIIMLLLLIVTRKNTTILVEEDGEFVIGGKEKLDKDNPEIDVNKYLDEETYAKKAMIILNDDISEKLDGKVITIKHRDEVIKFTVKYDDEPVEIMLKALDDNREDQI